MESSWNVSGFVGFAHVQALFCWVADGVLKYMFFGIPSWKTFLLLCSAFARRTVVLHVQEFEVCSLLKHSGRNNPKP